MSRNQVVKLDVREDIRAGRAPFGKIMQFVSALKPGQDLLLLAPFEPTPLFALLNAQGFQQESKQTDSGDWEVRFTRSEGAVPAGKRRQADAGPGPTVCGGEALVRVDARGLEPPEPMVKILEAVTSLPSGASLEALTDRRPVHLFAELEQRGFKAETEQQPDGSFRTTVVRR